MLKKTLLASLIASFALTAQDITFSNKTLEVTVTPKTGRFSVLDKRINRRWEQPVQAQFQAATPIPCPKLPVKPLANTISHTMLGDARNVSSSADCSATFTLAWDAQSLVVTADVKDDAFFPAKPSSAWWHGDSIELWINDRQFGVYVVPGNTNVHNTSQKPLKNSTCTTEKTDKGYKATIKLNANEIGLPPQINASFQFALGINDADSANGREGQIYFPKSWKHSTPSSFNPVVFTVSNTLDLNKQLTHDAFTDVQKTNRGIAYTWARSGEPTLLVKAELVDDLPELRFTVQAANPKEKLARNVPDIAGFLMTDETAGLAIANGTTGHFFPLAEEPFLCTSYNTGYDLPFIALSSLKTGQGYGLLVDTPDDGLWRMEKISLPNAKTTRVPRIAWLPTHQTFGEKPRVFRYHFLDKGGYVAVAKVWRKWAKENGYLVTLKEKAKHNPNVLRLMGAADIWGTNIHFIRAAYAEGIEKLLVNGGLSAKYMQEAIAFGYLPGRYDSYADVWDDEPDLKKLSHRAAPLPEHAVQNADGSYMTAWQTYDKKRTAMKRCTAVMLQAAKMDCTKDLAKMPYLARFLDVTTAEQLYECYNPEHPMTRSDKRRYSEGMCRYFGHWDKDCLNLVAGGEHGKWWCAKYLHYVEGMQSGGYAHYSWPAGYLQRPTNRFMNPRYPDKPTNWYVQRYDVYGIGPKYRIPLWDLALHDCISTTWYWGDSTDYLLQAAPESIPRKDALTILYASMPMFWVAQGTWTHDRTSFLRSYFHATKVHELVGMEQMTDHQFVNEDRTIHKTAFGDGTEIIVNMDNRLHTVKLKGKEYLLPPNGFAIDGPKLKQQLIYKDALFQSQVITDDFFFATKSNDINAHPDGSSSLVAMLRLKKRSPEHVTVSVNGDASIQIPQQFFKNWDWNKSLIYKLDEEGKRIGVVKPILKDNNVMLPTEGNFECLTGSLANLPDLTVKAVSIDLKAAKQLSVAVMNQGLLTTKPTIYVYLNQITPKTCVIKQSLQPLKANASQTVKLNLPMDKLAGRHKLFIKVEADNATELSPHNNETSTTVTVPFHANLWPFQMEIKLPVAKVDSKLEPVDVPVDFAKLLKPGQSIAPSSVYVGMQTHTGVELLPFAQFTPDKDFHPQTRPRGTVSVSVDTTAGKSLTLIVFAASKDMFAPGGPLFMPGPELGSGTLDTETYSIAFRNATPRDLAPGRAFHGGPDFLTNILISSGTTGWGNENNAKINTFDVRVNGPAKAVVHANVTLSNGVTYDKIYTLTPGRIVIDINVSALFCGNFSRGFYTLPGEYADSLGHYVVMDGKKNAANVAGQSPNPKWFAIKGDKWAKSCVSLSKGFDNISFWDSASPSHGQLGFTTSKQFKNLKLVYFVHGRQPDFNFAKHDYERATNPLK